MAGSIKNTHFSLYARILGTALIAYCTVCGIAHPDHVSEAACPSEVYIPAYILGRTVRIKLQAFDHQDSGAFAKVKVELNAIDQASLEALGYTHWSTVAVPLARIDDIPSYADKLPPPGRFENSNDPCAVTAIEREVYRGSLQLYARIAEIPSGSYLEILGRKLPTLLGDPLEYVRAVVKFMTVASDANRWPGAKTCGAVSNITCPPSGNATLLSDMVCGGGRPACDEITCCAQTCASAAVQCQEGLLLRTKQQCGGSLMGLPCDQNTCCEPEPEPMTCGKFYPPIKCEEQQELVFDRTCQLKNSDFGFSCTAAKCCDAAKVFPAGAACQDIDYKGTIFPEEACDPGYAFYLQGGLENGWESIGGMTMQQAKYVCCRRAKVYPPGTTCGNTTSAEHNNNNKYLTDAYPDGVPFQYCKLPITSGPNNIAYKQWAYEPASASVSLAGRTEIEARQLCCYNITQAYPPGATCNDVTGGVGTAHAFDRCLETISQAGYRQQINEYNVSAGSVSISGLHEDKARELCCPYKGYTCGTVTPTISCYMGTVLNVNKKCGPDVITPCTEWNCCERTSSPTLAASPSPSPEAPSQSPEVPSPSTEALALSPEVPSPSPEAPSPSPEVPSPSLEAPSQSPEVPSPSPEAPSPSPEVPSPSPEAPSPSPEPPSPSPEEPSPSPEPPSPSPEEPSPSPEPPSPSLEEPSRSPEEP